MGPFPSSRNRTIIVLEIYPLLKVDVDMQYRCMGKSGTGRVKGRAGQTQHGRELFASAIRLDTDES